MRFAHLKPLHYGFVILCQMLLPLEGYEAKITRRPHTFGRVGTSALLREHIRDSPITTKTTYVGYTHDRIPFGVSSMEGWHYGNEDAYVTVGLLYLYVNGTKMPL